MGRQFPALRGVAILLVVLNHSITLSLQAIGEYGYAKPPVFERYLLVALKLLGLFAVPTFLFLSGCFLVYAVQGKELKAAYRSVGLGLRHIVIPYLIWSVVFYLLIYVLQGVKFSLRGYIENLMTGYPFDFVPLLVFFYLLAPILVRVGAKYPVLVLLAFGLYQLFIINVLKPGVLGFTFPDWTYKLTPPALRLSMAIWGIYFPLGIIYSLHSQTLIGPLTRLGPLFAVAGLVTYGLALLTEISLANVPLVELVCPVCVILLFPLIRRDRIPFAASLEQIGKRSFGLYLTNLISLTLALVAIQAGLPWLYSQLFVLVPIIFVFAIVLPRLLMLAVEKSPIAVAQRYVFG